MRQQWDVFISYSRSSAGEAARRAHIALEAAGFRTFLDARDIPLDAEFPREIADALLDSRLFLAFLDEDYFQKRWCLYEFQAALAPAATARADSVEHILAVLVDEGAASLAAHLPPILARSNLTGPDPEAIVERVHARLARVATTIVQRLEGLDDFAVRTLQQGGAVPPAASLVHVPGYRDSMPRSLGDRLAGRAPELWLLFHELATVASDGAGRSCCIHGAPGTGKSQLAAEFVWRYAARHFPGGVVWIDATDQPAQTALQLRRAIDTLSAGEAQKLASSTSTETMRAQAAVGRVLWVIDGVPHPATGRGVPALEQWCPFRDHVTLLCTTQRARSIDVDVSFALDPLPDSAAVDLLTRSPVNRAWLPLPEWSELARWVGRLPQALSILHVVLASRMRSARDCVSLARVADPVRSLSAEMNDLRDDVPEGALRGIVETFDIWYEHLAQDRELRHAAHLLARARMNPVSEKLVPRGLLARLGQRSWLSAVDTTPEEAAQGRPETVWRLNDLIGSYLRGVSPDPAAEIAHLASYYLGFDGGQSTVLVGERHGGLDALANVSSLGVATLEDALRPLLLRAVDTPGDHEAARAAEVLGALRDPVAYQALARALEPSSTTAWKINLYMRYVQGFDHAPPEPTILRDDGATVTLDAASLLGSAASSQDRGALLAPLVAVLEEAGLDEARFAAGLMAKAKETRALVGPVLVRLVSRITADRLVQLTATVLQRDDKSAAAWAACGAAFNALGERDNAIAGFRVALEHEPRFPWAQEQLGLLLIESDPAEAVIHFDAALTIEPRNMPGLLGKASCLLLLERWAEAETTADAALALDSDEPLAWLARARARLAGGDVVAAQHDIDRALALQPGLEPAVRLRAALAGGAPPQ